MTTPDETRASPDDPAGPTGPDASADPALSLTDGGVVRAPEAGPAGDAPPVVPGTAASEPATTPAAPGSSTTPEPATGIPTTDTPLAEPAASDASDAATPGPEQSAEPAPSPAAPSIPVGPVTVAEPAAGGQPPHAAATQPPDAEETVAGAGGSGTTGSTGAPAHRRNLAALLVAGVVIALLAAGTALLGLRLQDARGTQAAREQATAASRDAARVLFSYDHATLDEDFQRGLAVTTGDFREEYTRTTRDVVADVAREYKAVVVADVVESAVVRASAEEVTTIVFLNQATTSTRVQGQQVDASRVRMTLVEREGRWLVSKVDAL